MTSNSPTISEARNALRALANTTRATDLKRFFKTGPGEYAEGDEFLGVAVPDTRRLVKQFQTVPVRSVPVLLKSRIHEERLMGLLR